MSLNGFLHNPTWLKVHVSALLGTIGLLALALECFVLARARKRDIYKPSVLLSEVHGPDDDEEIGSAQPSQFSANHPRYRRHRPIVPVLNVLCTAVIAFAYLFAVRGFIILTNWQDGHEREFIGDPVGAIICYKKALRADPTLRSTHLLIGEALYASGRARAAIPELLVAARGEESSPDAASTLGDAYQSLKMLDEAAAAYRQASAISPNDARYQLVLGVCLEKLHRWTEAIDAYEHALRLDRSDVLAHIRLGVLLVDSGRREEGMAHCMRAEMLAPRSVLAHNTLGNVYTQFSKNAEAFEEYKTTVELNPQFIIGQANLGLTLERMNEQERALKQFKACMKLTADNQEDKDILINVRARIHRLEAHLKNRL